MPTLEQARGWYDPNDLVHGFDHVERVYHMVEKLASEEGGDMVILRAAALLHDANGSETAGGEVGRQNHHHSSAQFAQQVLKAEGWDENRIEAVLHCIRSHRYRDNSSPPQSLEAKILFDADKLDVLGAIGAVRTVAYAVVIGQPVYAPASARFIQMGEREAGEPHSSYHEYLFKLSKIRDRLFTPTARQIAEQRHRFLEEFFYRLGAEMRGEA